MTMSPDSNKQAAKAAGKSETQSVSGRKTTQEPALKCPRCDSPNTKFCYYNNYSLAQPRHFCKTCRRYWTRGGALRNVPIGGGCRKNRKMKSSSPRLSGDSTDVGGLKLFQGISPAMDFQINFPQNTALLNQFSSFGEFSNAISSGFQGNINHSPGFQEIGSLNLHSNLANSIESLSSINQDLHLKLQQQRLSMFFANNQKENSANLSSVEHFAQKPEPILFQNLDISKTNPCGIGKKDGNLSTEWFFDNSYGNMNPTPATSSSNVNENNSNWGGVQAWSDLAQYTSLP